MPIDAGLLASPVSDNAASGTPLRRRRYAARKTEWQAVQALQALPAPDVSLRPVVSSNSNPEQLSWEILE
jgi:hypothetical protein